MVIVLRKLAKPVTGGDLRVSPFFHSPYHCFLIYIII